MIKGYKYYTYTDYTHALCDKERKVFFVYIHIFQHIKDHTGKSLKAHHVQEFCNIFSAIIFFTRISHLCPSNFFMYQLDS